MTEDDKSGKKQFGMALQDLQETFDKLEGDRQKTLMSLKDIEKLSLAMLQRCCAISWTLFRLQTSSQRAIGCPAA
jgi:hypothetical protein